ncbi:MAG: DUF4445 domain-containing protein [Acidobacteria bacterium]|nr:MAG: DUF4445 domain-containing protein [Acidobacteriota bacterium]
MVSGTVSAHSFTVRFLPDDRVHTATGPVDLYLAAAAAGILVEQPCGAQGTCGRCRVRVLDGEVPPGEEDRLHLTPPELAAGWRLGCKLTFTGHATVEVPSVVRSLAGKSFGPERVAGGGRDPVVQVHRAVLPPSKAEGPVSGDDRLWAALGKSTRPQTTPASLADLGGVEAQRGPWTVWLDKNGLLAASPGDGGDGYGLAVDIGTTSLAVGLIALADGGVVASASCLNPQVALGADVIARIKHASESPDGGANLARLVREGLAFLIRNLLVEAGCQERDVVLAAAAGNPTMLQAWAGVRLTSLGTAPYAAAWSVEQHWRAADVGLPIHQGASVYVFPMIRSHVGGDAVAAAVASDFDLGQAPRLLVDLGTNCEVMVGCGDRVVATSAAAGPAFEGVSIRCGMRAAPGAIDVVSLEPSGDVRIHVVGDRPAAGLCGSALIDLVAEMLRVGLLDPSGYLRKPHELPASAQAFAGRLMECDGQAAFLVAASGEAATRDVLLTARDVRELQLAKGSTLAAITIACRSLGLDPADLEEVSVAGAFGNFLRKASVIRMRLVPVVDAERIRFVGNAAGVGARLALLDRGVRARAAALALRAEYLDLATHRDYQDTFMRTLSF